MIKYIEVRDRMTFIPCFAFRVCSAEYLAKRAGYHDGCVIIFGRLDYPERTQNCSHNWNDRTMHVAHHYLEEHWDDVYDDTVVDVEFILNETTEPKRSERYDA